MASKFAILAATLALAGALSASAGAVLVHFGKHQVAGVTPIAGVKPGAISGSFARRASGKAAADDGTLASGGGPVLHATSPYVIFWDPANAISAADKALYTRYFADLSVDSGKATNVFAVDRQFTDATGFANNAVTWDASHAITDTDAYPTTGNCTEHSSGFTESNCLYDSQLRAEVARVVSADALPSGYTGAAPIYFLVTPPDVNSCDDPVQGQPASCADNTFCAYHSIFNPAPGSSIVYANIPLLLAAQAPKECQADGNGAVQTPNGNSTIDVALKYTSHEYSESITDPVVGLGWTDPKSGQEDGDQCNFTGAADPASGDNPNAFLPTLGGTAGAGTLYDQLINGDQYYTQTEWSNAGLDCEAQPTAMAVTSAFTAPSSAQPGTAASFSPTGSTAAAGYSSATWSWGDGTANSFNIGAPTTVSHTFTAPGAFTVTLTLVDKYGNVSTASHGVTVTAVPHAAFSVSSTTASAGTAIEFNGAGSNEPGGSIASYAWNFGDGSTGTGAALAHAFAKAGTYTVALTVTDPSGASTSTSQQVTIVGAPTAAIAIVEGHAVADVPFALDGSQSTDTGSTITAYSWSFGDGATATGTSPSHAFTKTGNIPVTLTVTDASGATASITEAIVVKAPSISKVSVKKGTKSVQLKVSLSGPGTLRLGSKKTKVKGPKTVTLKVALSRAQRHTLSARHKLTVRFKLSFAPAVGKPSRKTVTIKLGKK
jgi:PKD repeat protein